jgi:hypothetical protein
MFYIENTFLVFEPKISEFHEKCLDYDLEFDEPEKKMLRRMLVLLSSFFAG